MVYSVSFSEIELQGYVGKRVRIRKDSPEGAPYGGLSGVVVGFNAGRAEDDETPDERVLIVALECPNTGEKELVCVDYWSGALWPKIIAVGALWHGLRKIYVKNIDGHRYIVAEAAGGVISIRISPNSVCLIADNGI